MEIAAYLICLFLTIAVGLYGYLALFSKPIDNEDLETEINTIPIMRLKQTLVYPDLETSIDILETNNRKKQSRNLITEIQILETRILNLETDRKDLETRLLHLEYRLDHSPSIVSLEQAWDFR